MILETFFNHFEWLAVTWIIIVGWASPTITTADEMINQVRYI